LAEMIQQDVHPLNHVS